MDRRPGRSSCFGTGPTRSLARARPALAFALFGLLGGCAGSSEPARKAPIHASHPKKGHPEKGHPEKGHPEKGHPEKGHPEKGRGPVHHRRFVDAKKWSARFDAPERDTWQKPDVVLDLLHLVPGQAVADIGAGTGYFSARFAKRLPKGKVFAVDLEPTLLAHMKKRFAAAKLADRVQTVQASASDARLPQPVDLLFVCNTYHHIQRRIAYFKKLATHLRPGGKLAIVDWKKTAKMKMGPPPSHRTPPSLVDQELVAAGYKRTLLDEKTLPHQFIVIYIR